MEPQKTLQTKQILRRKGQCRGFTIADILWSCISQNSVRLLQKHTYRPIEQQQKYPNMTACSYSQLIFDKDTKIMKWEKTLSSTNSDEKNYVSIHRRAKLDSFLSRWTKVIFKESKTSVWNPKQRTARRNHRQYYKMQVQEKASEYDSISSGVKVNHWQMGPHKSTKISFNQPFSPVHLSCFFFFFLRVSLAVLKLML